MDTVSDRGSVAINSPASVSGPARAGPMAQRHGSPASLAVVVGCSPTVLIDLASASLWPSRAVRPDRVAVPCPAASPASRVARAQPPRGDGFSEYSEDMNESSSRSLGRIVVAGLILLVAAWVLLHFVIGIVTAIASILVVVLAIVAIIWACASIF